MKCYEKSVAYGACIFWTGDVFFGKQSLVQETKLHISGIHELRIIQEKPAGKTLFIMINIVAKPFEIWAYGHVSMWAVVKTILRHSKESRSSDSHREQSCSCLCD